jgi:hypothetical protein
MKVVNPLNRVPLSMETTVNGNCHCVCSSGSSAAYTVAWMSLFHSCRCQCDGDTTNNNYNNNTANDA